MSIPNKPASIFIVVPAYNEFSVIRQVLIHLASYHYSIVVVDDGSEENLYPCIKNLPVYFLRHRINLGQGAALQTGIDFALTKQAKYIVTFDADGQHNAGDIEKMIDFLQNTSSDIIFGSRFMKGAVHNMPLTRKMMLQTARFLNYIFTGILLTDAHNGLRVMTRKAAACLKIKENRMAHATEILYLVKKNKLKYAELPVTVEYTDYSLHKGQTTTNSFRVLLDILINKIFR